MAPSEPELPSGLEIAGRCVPAAGNLTGGDWYDVVPLSRGCVGVVVGDVMGHGPGAAALMDELRAAAHDLAASGMAPAHLLGRLEHTASELGDVVYATCAYAVIDPAEGCATVALAGHLPPVVAMTGGVTRVPELPAGLSLGLGNGKFSDVQINLPPGSVLALFTDGLVETRIRSYEIGVRALRDMLAEVPDGDLEQACDAIVGSLAPELEDDTTIVLVRVPGR